MYTKSIIQAEYYLKWVLIIYHYYCSLKYEIGNFILVSYNLAKYASKVINKNKNVIFNLHTPLESMNFYIINFWI